MVDQPTTINTRAVEARDAGDWARLRHALWPDATETEHREEIDRFLAGIAREPLAVFVAEKRGGRDEGARDDGTRDEGERILGFAELSIRAHAEGCRTDRVAFLEGWFVARDARGRGVGRALIAAAETWAREQGCTEFASDTAADDEASADAHRALGFEDVGLIRCFRKGL